MEEQPSDDYGMEDMVGVIKIKDGLFICDEIGAQVSKLLNFTWMLYDGFLHAKTQFKNVATFSDYFSYMYRTSNL